MVTVMEVKLKLNSLSNVLAIQYNYDIIPQDSNTTTSLLSMKYVAVSMVKISYTSTYENDLMDAIFLWMYYDICMKYVQFICEKHE